MKFKLVEAIDDELMTREEAEGLAEEECEQNPQAEYIWFGQKAKGNIRPVFHYPESITADQLEGLRQRYSDVFALRNPNYEDKQS